MSTFDLPEETIVSKGKQNTGNSPLAKVLRPPKQIKKVSYNFVILHTIVTMLLPFLLCAKKLQPTNQKKTKPLTPNQTTIHNYFVVFSLACNESTSQVKRHSLKPSKHCGPTQMDKEERRKTNRPKGHEIFFDTLSDTLKGQT